MQVDLTCHNDKEWRFTAVLRPGVEKRGTVGAARTLNRHETEYVVNVHDGHAWKVIILRLLAGSGVKWRIADEPPSIANARDPYASPMLALRDGAIPYIITQELQR